MSVASAARRAALRVLHEVVSGGPTLAERLAHPRIESLDHRDRDFLHELVYGTLRRRGALDVALRRVIDRDLGAVDPTLLDLLRLGAYQILHTRVPARAAVFESVALAREVAPRGAGFANAVLRRLAAEGAPPAPAAADDPIGWLTSEGSLPGWLAERWLRQLGAEDAVARARAFLEPAPTCFRINPRLADVHRRLTEAGVQMRPGVVPGCFVLASGRLQPVVAAGAVYVQDEGSQLVAHVARLESGRVLDACASPGGKATLLADLAPEAHIVAVEPSAKRRSVLRRTVERWGASNVFVIGADATRPPLAPVFDAVLLDAPCTGLGTLSRRPDLRWRVAPVDIERHAGAQRMLLESVASLVRPGGRLVYSTCSLEPEETEEVVGGFLASGAPFALTPPPEVATPFVEGAFVRLLPERRGGDGFFVACLRRRKKAV